MALSDFTSRFASGPLRIWSISRSRERCCCRKYPAAWGEVVGGASRLGVEVENVLGDDPVDGWAHAWERIPVPVPAATWAASAGMTGASRV